jgi:hypothetical protein
MASAGRLRLEFDRYRGFAPSQIPTFAEAGPARRFAGQRRNYRAERQARRNQRENFPGCKPLKAGVWQRTRREKPSSGASRHLLPQEAGEGKRSNQYE